MKKFLQSMQAGLALRAEELLANAPASPNARSLGLQASNGATGPQEELCGDEPMDAVLQRILSRVRSEEVRSHIADAPASQYTRHHSVRLQALTYNVAGKKPPEDLSLAGWLEPGHGESASDVIAVGFQELVPLHAGNVLTGGEDREAAAAWIDLIQAALNAPCGGNEGTDTGNDAADQYVVLAERQLVGLYLTVWVHVRMLPHVRGLQICTVATGFGGVLANKGAVAIRMRVYDTGLCWVCSHLAAGDSQAAFTRRLLDFQEIIKRVEFPVESGQGLADPAAPVKGRSSLVVEASSKGDWGPGASLLAPCHHHTIFMGDMNFRWPSVALPAPPLCCPTLPLPKAQLLPSHVVGTSSSKGTIPDPPF
mmetsp:Transcript_24146/g.67148  ORF Transcript_24146/g.67148 Transcript_24146/m.67148 type:complete len:367 (-) Transcript_24146:2315-3415(-)